MLRLAATEFLEEAGYSVVQVADGDRAYEILKSESAVDLLISDIKMPGLNGYRLAEAGLGLRPKLRIILMTGYTQESVPESIRSSGVEVIQKPFDFDDLVRTAGRMLESC
jgi:DNA-binding NtrC family response regulator